jgi:hypothetical protein
MKRQILAVAALLSILGLALISVRAQQQPAPLPSITPLFYGGAPAAVQVFGASSGSGAQQPFTQPTLAAGQASSFSAQVVATAPPGGASFSNQAQATPPPVQFNTQPLAATSPAGIPTLAPSIIISSEGQEASEGVLAGVFNNIIVPVVNFILTLINGTVTVAWNFAGDQGGLLAQGLCCIAPVILGGWYFIFRRGIFGRRR